MFRTAAAMGIKTVAVYSDPDSGAPHVREADEAVRLPGATSAETYLSIPKIIEAALATNADAVHPGYGFLSENADFATACADAGLTFVGPPVEAIRTMGSKIAAKEMMARAGVPVLPGGVVNDGYRPEPSDYPVLVKAAFGGGGRGMRIVHSLNDLDDAVAAAGREAQAAFGDGTVFVERYLQDPRHIEVQIFGDTNGRVLHLFERECSIQRRYQKVIEEAPSPAVNDELRAELCAAAVSAGEALGYVGAGTVEFVLDPAGRFYFLEVNTRLQVEHPVTELVTGLDLVELQLRVAAGEPLTISPTLDGHAIEARLYAEDPTADFAPMSGRIDRFEIPSSDGVRIDSGYETGSTVSTFYDAMIAKVIAYGPTRERAAQRLASALDAAELHGPPTNRDLLVGVLRHPEFLAGFTDTGFLARHSPAELIGPDHDPLSAVAAALASQAHRRLTAPVQRHIPSGWRNVSTGPRQVAYIEGEQIIEVSYVLTRSGIAIQIGGEPIADARLEHADATSVVLSVGGMSRRYGVHLVADACYVDGPVISTRLVPIDRLPEPGSTAAAGSLLAPLPGSVIRVLVAANDAVVAGQTIAILEAMKMEHPIVSPVTGLISELLITVGQQMDTGQPLAIIEETTDG
ncbi:MAG TPA: biotin carboxylase N-terminal domain-containing protein [Mycobacteriales bacterium]|nr:biotin carboxylase N-terminal domain-containing protein [Mycobacteriales bacterium]